MSYIQDPNNSKKQIPNTSEISIFKRVSYAVAIPATSMSKRPHQVICTTNGTYAFAYESGSLSTYITGSVVQSANAGAVTLDINPVAWRQTNGDGIGAKGDVIFVYRRIA